MLLQVINYSEDGLTRNNWLPWRSNQRKKLKSVTHGRSRALHGPDGTCLKVGYEYDSGHLTAEIHYLADGSVKEEEQFRPSPRPSDKSQSRGHRELAPRLKRRLIRANTPHQLTVPQKSSGLQQRQTGVYGKHFRSIRRNPQ